MNFTAFISGFLGGAVSVGIAILWMQVGWAIRQSGIFVKSPGKASKINRVSPVNSNPDINSNSDSDSAEIEELKRRYDADLKAFSDTMNYSADRAYGIGEA